MTACTGKTLTALIQKHCKGLCDNAKSMCASGEARAFLLLPAVNRKPSGAGKPSARAEGGQEESSTKGQRTVELDGNKVRVGRFGLGEG